MRKAGLMMKAAAAVCLVIAAFAPEVVLPLILASIVLMGAGWLVGGLAENRPELTESGRALAIGRIALLVVCAGFIFHGIMNGGMQAVLMKAVRICMECIGLG